MKFKYLVMFILFFASILKSDTPTGALISFSSSWLYQYNHDDYDLKIHPFTLNDVSVTNTEVLWDLNSDGVVNFHDFMIFNRLDLPKMVDDMEVLKQTQLTSETVDDLVSMIYHQEIINGISDFKLFKILLLQSGFEVRVNKAQYGLINFEVDLNLMWANETKSGWIKILWQDDGLLKYKYTFQYLVESKALLNEE
jgi:hypothetical protein